jgi:PIN domain nuclease of toxin-antitoxin system
VILLDTHTAYWLNHAPEKLSAAASRAIQRAAASTDLGLSSISLWELAMLIEGGRLRLRGVGTHGFLETLVQTPGLIVLEITAEIAALAAQLPSGLPRDPGDSLIAATARVYDVAIVTKDQRMQESPLLRTIW